jgi:hypothetical protein
MELDVPTYEPTSITAGETLKWTKDLGDYPASDYTLKYYFRGGGAGFDATANANGDTHEIEVAATTTAPLAAGTLYWQAWVEKDDEKYVVDAGQVEVKPGLAALAAAETHDGRSKAKVILDAIDDMVEGKATRDQQEYTIGNRMLKRIPIPDLILLREKYAQIYARERRTERLKQGAPFLKNIHMRFREPR